MEAESKLEKALRIVAEAEARLKRHRMVVRKLGRGGHDTTTARQLLKQMEESLIYLSARQKMLKPGP
ncbi:MAG: hypothetical protein JO303_13365 [Caulobacteraceae bacterium]|nr:hypothetical protein [Caulobacteraceae bacterium]